MFPAQLRNWIFGSMLLLPLLSNAQSGDEVRVIHVDANAISAYGHWISDDGVVELRYQHATGTLLADGWQISPELTLHDLDPTPPPGITDMASQSPWGTLGHQVAVMRDSMFAAGDSPKTVISACKNKLRNSGLVDLSATSDDGEKVEGGIQYVGGPNYRIYRTGGKTCVMPLGNQLKAPGQEQLKAVRERQSHGLFLALAAHLEAGHMYLISAYPMPTGSFIPRANRDEVAALLRGARKASSPITAENWQDDDVISYCFAEQARIPLPIRRKGVR